MFLNVLTKTDIDISLDILFYLDSRSAGRIVVVEIFIVFQSEEKTFIYCVCSFPYCYSIPKVQIASGHKMIQPDIPAVMGLLTHLNSDELKEMLNDDTKFDTVLKDVKQVQYLVLISGI